ncbi:hypothetical protein KCU65_g5740, partial [Aureobasidium melanogenum]
MSYRSYQTYSGQSSYVRQPSRSASSSQPRQYSSAQQYSSRRPALYHSRVYRSSNSDDDSSSDSESESDSDDDEPYQSQQRYYQTSHASMHEQERAANNQRVREQLRREESQRVLDMGYSSYHTAATRPMNLLTQSLNPHTPAGRYYADEHRAEQNRTYRQRLYQSEQGSTSASRTQNVQYSGSGSGADPRVESSRSSGVSRQPSRRRYY